MATTSTAPISFPLKKTVTLSIEVDIADQFDLDSLITDDNASAGFLADVLDVVTSELGYGIISINGKTPAQIKALLEKEMQDSSSV
jgi:hypothetical protein